jgi:tetratricopeptide (TPR) repeat protein
LVVLRSSSSSAVRKAADYLRHALELDRTFAAAWAVLAVVIQDDFVIYSTSPYQKARAEAYPAAERALKLDPHLSDAHLAMAQILYDLDFDFDGAHAEVDRAVALDPGSSGAFRVASQIALTEGRLGEARQLAQQAVIRDPLAVGNYVALGDADLLSGRLDDAEAAWRKALELNAAAEGIHYRLGAMLVLRGETAAALAEMERNPDEPWRLAGLPLALDALGRRSEADRVLAVAVEKLAVEGPYQIAVIYAHRNDVDRAFAWLDRAYEERDGALAGFVKEDPLLSNLRHDLLRGANAQDEVAEVARNRNSRTFSSVETAAACVLTARQRTLPATQRSILRREATPARNAVSAPAAVASTVHVRLGACGFGRGRGETSAATP